VGGVPGSAHTHGLAADIAASAPRQRFKIIHGLIHMGFKRVLIYRDFIHADMDETKPQEVITLK